MSQNETISLEEATFRNQLVSRLASIDTTLEIINKRLEVGEQEFKLQASKCSVCAPTKDIESVKKWSVIALLGVVVLFAKQILSFCGIIK